MLEIKCPGCGAGGRVPRDKKTNRLVCKKCLRVFHLGPTGHPMLGEPPERKEVIEQRAPRESSGYEFGGSIDDMAARLGRIKIPKVSLRTLGITAGVALVAAVGYLFFSGQSLETRSKTVAKAIMGTDMETVMAVAAPETAFDLIMWSDRVIRKYGELKMALGGADAGVTVNVLSDGSSGPAVVVVKFSAEGTRLGAAGVEAFQPTPSLSNTKSSYEIHLYWVKNMWGTWILDGKRTAEYVPP